MNPNLAFLKAFRGKYALLQGGTRSGKTYSALHWIVWLCGQYPNSGLIVSICRKTMPALRATAMRDFLEILRGLGAYSEADHNMSQHTYSLFGNLVEFVNLDDEQKVRGRKRHVLYVNEANEDVMEVIRQLLYRTSGPAVFDFNPSISEEHWLLSEILPRKGAHRIITTYRDNPHLSASQVEEIEMLRERSPDDWRVFGLGEVGGAVRGLIYPDWAEADMPQAGRVAYGLDFGFHPDPTALVEVRVDGDRLFARELLYQHRLTVSDLIALMRPLVKGSAPIYADHRTEMIEELWRAGFNIHKAEKGPGSVKHGIETVKRHRLHIAPDSLSLQKELRRYRWAEDREGASTGEPLGVFDHALDALRYAAVGLARIQNPGAVGPTWLTPQMKR